MLVPAPPAWADPDYPLNPKPSTHRRMASFDMLTPAKEAELKENLWQIAKLEKAVQQVNPTPYTLHPKPYTLSNLEMVSNG
jgi:hypothetical protein